MEEYGFGMRHRYPWLTDRLFVCDRIYDDIRRDCVGYTSHVRDAYGSWDPEINLNY